MKACHRPRNGAGRGRRSILLPRAGGGQQTHCPRGAPTKPVASPGAAMSDPNALEPWQWAEEHWRRLAGPRPCRPVACGRNPGPAAPAALWRSPSTRTTRPTNCATAASPSDACRGASTAIGSGVPRILKLLEKYGVRATFFVPAVTALLYPDEQRRVIAEGHEIGIHGWIHELNSVLPDARARSPDARRRDAGEDHRGAAGGHAHAFLGLQPAHARHREGDGPALRFTR